MGEPMGQREELEIKLIEGFEKLVIGGEIDPVIYDLKTPSQMKPYANYIGRIIKCMDLNLIVKRVILIYLYFVEMKLFAN